MPASADRTNSSRSRSVPMRGASGETLSFTSGLCRSSDVPFPFSSHSILSCFSSSTGPSGGPGGSSAQGGRCVVGGGGGTWLEEAMVRGARLSSSECKLRKLKASAATPLHAAYVQSALAHGQRPKRAAGHGAEEGSPNCLTLASRSSDGHHTGPVHPCWMSARCSGN